MIPPSVRDQISRYLGRDAKPFFIVSADGTGDQGCEYWNLPPLQGEDKPVLLRYQELASELSDRIQRNENDPQIERLKSQISALFAGLRGARKFGTSVYSIRDLWAADQNKGLRKEWIELQAQFSGSSICVFQGYQSASARTTHVADILIAVPNPDPYEWVRMHKTRGNNHPINTEKIIDSLKRFDQEIGIRLVSAESESVEFIFQRSVDPQDIKRIRSRLHLLCPSAEELSASIRLGRVMLWWD